MKTVTLLFHDAVEAGRPDESGFRGSAPNRYKLNADEMQRHFARIAEKRHEPPLRITSFIDGEPIPENNFLMTFDDGGASAYRFIAPMLETLGWVGHFFVTAGMIDQPGFLTSAEVRELSSRGHLIGSHSWSHPPRMSSCSVEEQRSEWKRSKDLLSEIIGSEVRIASVPGGFYSRQVGEIASDCGIRALFTSEPRKACRQVADCLVIGRYTLIRGMSSDVSHSLASVSFSSQQMRQSMLWETKKLLKKVGGERYLALRKLILRNLRSE